MTEDMIRIQSNGNILLYPKNIKNSMSHIWEKYKIDFSRIETNHKINLTELREISNDEIAIMFVYDILRGSLNSKLYINNECNNSNDNNNINEYSYLRNNLNRSRSVKEAESYYEKAKKILNYHQQETKI